MLNITLTVKEKVTATIDPVNFVGKKRPVEKTIWKVLSGDCIVNPSEDGLSAEIISPETPGESIIQVGADADMNPKKDQFIYNTIHVAVVEKRVDKSHGEATNLQLTIGSPKPKKKEK